MNCQRIRDHLLESIDGRLPDALAAEVTAHLADCAACRAASAAQAQTLRALDGLPAPQPTPRLRAGVLAAIAAEKSAQRVSRWAPPRRIDRPARLRPVWQVLAAGALLSLGYLAGAHRPPVAPTPPPESSSRQEIADLHRQVESMGQLVGYALLRQQQLSAYDRLEGVLATAAEARPDATAIDDLIATLALDPSVNVRLNALEALYRHADQKVVRAAVLASLQRETNPLVQVAMIDFLTATRDREATPALQRLVLNDAADANVRDAARRALVHF
jgi:hypothetical protein